MSFGCGALADAPNNSLPHQVSTALGPFAGEILKLKPYFPAGCGGLLYLDGQFAAYVAFYEGRLISFFLLAPGVHAKQGEIAWLAFREFPPRDIELWDCSTRPPRD